MTKIDLVDQRQSVSERLSQAMGWGPLRQGNRLEVAGQVARNEVVVVPIDKAYELALRLERLERLLSVIQEGTTLQRVYSESRAIPPRRRYVAPPMIQRAF